MQRFQFYVPEGYDVPTLGEMAEALLAVPGVKLEAGDGYHPGTWRCEDTGAKAVIDLGDPPLEEDYQHPPRQYLNWTQLSLAIQVPLVGPHWQAVEGFQTIEAVLAGLPEAVRALDCEDAQETPEAEAGPFAWKRPRVLASWERLHVVQVETRTDLARMPRGDSLRLWRWRRERSDGIAAHANLLWPEARVLRDRATAEAAAVCVWTDTTKPIALPAAGLVLLAGPEPLLVRRADLPAGSELTHAGATRVEPLRQRPTGLPIDRFSACADEDWVD